MRSLRCCWRCDATHSEQFEAVEALARDDRHVLHLAQEASLGGREAGREGEGHGGRAGMAGRCFDSVPGGGWKRVVEG